MIVKNNSVSCSNKYKWDVICTANVSISNSSNGNVFNSSKINCTPVNNWPRVNLDYTACGFCIGGCGVNCTDADHDGYNVSQTGCGSLFDCNDNNASIKPGAIEICNGIDDNCVNGVDEGCSCTNGQIKVCGSSVCE